MENFETHIKCSVKGWLEVAYQISPLENPWSQIYWQMCKVFGIRPTDYICICKSLNYGSPAGALI